MEEAGVQIRPATLDDVEKIRQSVQYTLANPAGRPQRKRFEEAIQRHELVVLARYDPRERTDRVIGFAEWHTRVDNTVTIRDLGTAGETPNLGILKRLVRELLRMLSPAVATVKLRQDQPLWNSVFEETAGFQLEGQEFSRPYWRNIWTWTPERERALLRPARPTPAPGVPAARRRRR